MQDFGKMKIICNLSRNISTCNINLGKYAAREGRMMTKIMRGEQGKRKWYMNPERVAPNIITSKKPVLPQNNRRNTVLNKIFMKYITDLMATGEVAPDILGKGIQVTRVSVTSDFHQINVFWFAKEMEANDKLVKEILTKAERPLRHELSQLRVMGVVPNIKFVKDREYIKVLEIDKKLAIADFGEDFVPTDPTLRLKTTPVLKVKLPSEVWADIEKLELDVKEDELESVEEPLPIMQNDILGLSQARIMNKIRGSLDKSKKSFLNRSLNIVRPEPSDMEPSSEVTEYMTVEQKNATFSAFLTKRHLDEKRKRKYEMNRNSGSEDELYFFDEREVDDDDEVLDIDIHAEKSQER